VIATIAALLIWGAPAQATAQMPRNVKGTVVDVSGAVLPGVTVDATGTDGTSLATTVSNAVGEFTLEGLPAGPVALLFHLDGFADARATVSDRDQRLVQRLELSSFAETVTVRGAPPPPPPPPPRVLAPVPDHDPASVCGPAKAESIVPAYGTILSARKKETQGLYAAGDEIFVDPGMVNLLSVGQNYVVRRRYSTPLTDSRNPATMGEHTAGLLQIVDVDGASATAVVVYACDEMMRSDYLAPFHPEPVRTPDPAGPPAFDKAAKLLFGAPGKMLGSTNRLLVISQGARDGVQTGQRMTIFRRSRFSPTPVILGDAVVVAVRRESATIRVERATDVIFLGDGGDWVAPQRPAQASR